MSIQATSYVLHRRYGSQTRKLLMIAIADFANDDGEAWPSVDTLAQRAECSRRAVQENIRALQIEGELALHPNAGPRGCNLYRVIFKKTEHRKIAPKGGAPAAPPVQMSAAQTHGGGADERRPDAPEPLGTVREPSRERERTPAQPPAEFSEEEFCDTIEFVTTLRPGWDTAFSAKERTAFSANADALRTITPTGRAAIRRFLTARLAQGHAYWQPKTRFQFLTDSSDVLAHALDWAAKQPKPAAPKPKPSSAPADAAPPMTPEEIAACLSTR